MGSFIASLLSSVDGFDANNEFEPAAEEHQVFNDLLAKVEGVVFDRDNYDLLVPYWDVLDLIDPALDPVAREFSEIFRNRRRYVVDKFPGLVDPLATLIDVDPIEPLRELRTRGGSMMIAAGPDLLTRLFDHGLIDEVEVLMLPIVLGEGARQIGSLARKLPLHLVEARSLLSGAVFLRYTLRLSTA